MIPDGEVDVYSTGVLSELLAIGRCLNPWWLRRSPRPAWLPRHPKADQLLADHRQLPPWRRAGLAHSLRRLRRNGTSRSQWRGWYAEGKVGAGRVGTGWTRRRALADLARAQQEHWQW